MSLVQKSYRISTGDYKRALENGARDIIARPERLKVVKAEVFEVSPMEYWLNYVIEDGEKDNNG